MNAEQSAKLRTPFDPSVIGKLPRKTKEGKTIYLDFVGHAHVTNLLLDVDPEWTWEPMGTDERGLPAIATGLGEANEPVCLWIKLTVCGVTRPGFGSGKSAKEAISDAIRNAAMRFGVALDLWAKEDLHASNGSAGDPRRDTGSSESGPSAGSQSAMSGDEPASPAESLTEKAQKAQAARAAKPATKAEIAKIDALIPKAAKLRKLTEAKARAAIENDYGPLADLTQEKALELVGKLERWAAA